MGILGARGGESDGVGSLGEGGTETVRYSDSQMDWITGVCSFLFLSFFTSLFLYIRILTRFFSLIPFVLYE